MAGGKRRHRELARVDRAIVLHEDHRFGGLAGPGTVEPIEFFEMGDEIAAALGRAGVDDELARDVIERPQHGDLLGLSRRRHDAGRPPPLPMRGRDWDASTPRSRRLKRRTMSPASACCLRNCRRRPIRSNSPAIWRPFSVCRGRRQRNFFRNALDSCERLMRTPSRASISARRLTDRPVASVGHRLLQQGRDHTQRRFTLHRGWAGRHARF